MVNDLKNPLADLYIIFFNFFYVFPIYHSLQDFEASDVSELLVLHMVELMRMLPIQI